MKKILTGLFAGAALTVLGACLLPVGNGENLTKDNEVIPPIPPDTNLTFVWNNVISKNGCTTCHSGSNPQGSMNLSSIVNMRAAFFGITGSDTVPVLTTKAPTVHPVHRVQPGSPDSSYLYQKVTGIFSTPQKSTPDDQMPRPPYSFLDADELKIVRAWIARGASLE
jgi:hypothetical protein